MYTTPEANTIGLGMIGGGHLEHAAKTILDGKARTLIILENDLYRRADAALVDAMLDKAEQVVVVDHTMTPTAMRADTVLPAATFAEGAGTLVNNIGRAQRFMEVVRPEGEITESWRWLRRINTAAGYGLVTEWLDLDSFLKELVREIPVFARIVGAAAPASFRVGGLKIPRQSLRYSGRTAMKANIAVSETGVVPDLDSPLSFSMEAFSCLTPAALMSSFWTPGWNSAQSITRFQEEVNGPLEGGDPGIRLIDPDPDSRIPYFRAPGAAEHSAKRFTAVGRQHIFGSEELSNISPPIAQLMPSPYVLLHPLDATALGVGVGDTAEVHVSGAASVQLRVVFGPAIARGVIGLPEGLPGMPYIALPAAADVRKGAAAR